MTDFALVGKKGTGKSKNFIRLCRYEYFPKGRRVATNLDIYLEKMFGPYSRITYVRVPDKPTAFDLEAAGHGNPDSYDEEKNGALGLDELGTWLNSRSFADKERAGLLDFLAHARKHGWDCYYIMQSIAQVDKQLRESFIEFTVRHVRFDKVKIPFVGGILGALFGKRFAYLPKFHRAVTRLGYNPQDLATDSAMFIGKELEDCYDTRQVFRLDYEHGTYSVLSPWHLKGRFMESEKGTWWARLVAWWKQPPRKPQPPLVRPSPEYARVLELAKSLPPDQALAVVARFARSEKQRPGNHAGQRRGAVPVGQCHQA